MSTFTTTSPTSGGAVPSGVSVIGGVVLDMIGLNGARVVCQLSASGLFVGYFDSGDPAGYRGNPGTIGVQSGFTPSVVAALGGGIADLAVRITLSDGDTASGNFDFNDNALLLNGFNLGNFSSVTTEITDGSGNSVTSGTAGFPDNQLATGWFHTTDSTFLSSLYSSLSSQSVTFALSDIDPYDNFFDFTQGIDGGLINVGSPPNVSPALDLNGEGDGAGVSLAYTENDGAVQIAPDATVSDADSANFDGGILNVGFTENGSTDQLGIQNQGTDAGQIGVSEGTVTYGGTTIGTFTQPSLGGNLVVFLNSSATVAAVEALTRAITFENASENPPTEQRSVAFVVTDGDGGSTQQTATIDVSEAVAAPPSGADATVTTAEDITYRFTSEDFGYSVTPFDTVTITALPTNGSLTFNGTAATLNLVISVSDLDNGNLLFRPAADANGESYDSFDFTIEVDSQSSSGNTITIDVTPVNDLPVISNLIQNGSFETVDAAVGEGGNASFSEGSTALSGWTISRPDGSVTPGEVDFIEATTWNAAAGSHSIDLNGGQPGVLSQTFATIIGQKYSVTFAYGTNPVNSTHLHVEVGGKARDYNPATSGAVGSYPTTPGVVNWAYDTITFVATAISTTLVFTGDPATGASGPAIDDVSVQAVALFRKGASGAIALSVSDVDSESLTVTLSVAHGALTIDFSELDLIVSDGDGSDGTLSFTGSASDINAALASLIYTPDPNYSGTDALTLTADDGAGGLPVSSTVPIEVAIMGAGDGSGNDDLTGTPGDDLISGLGGDDTVHPLGGNDTADGGSNGAVGDTVSYEGAASGVVVRLEDSYASDGDGGEDNIYNFENVTGSQHYDSLFGDGNDNQLTGLGGGDVFWGFGGNDHIDGGDGWDEVRYEQDADNGGHDGVIVNLSSNLYWDYLADDFAPGHGASTVDPGTARDGFGNTDTLTSIESVFGTNSGDVLIGDDNDNSFFALAGSDKIYGGDGFDTVNFNASWGEGYEVQTGISINISDANYDQTFGALHVAIAANTATDSYGATDYVYGIEGVGGTDFADIMVGNDDGNYFIGGAGGDFFDGQGGFDTVEYDWWFNGVDREHGIVANLSNSTYEIPDELSGSFGGQESVGAGQVLTGYYAPPEESSFAPGDVPVFDTLRNIERINGSHYADILVGGDGENDLIGNDGDDLLIGGSGGFNYMSGGRGTDTYVGGNGPEGDGIDFGPEDGSHGVIVNLSGTTITADEINTNIDNANGSNGLPRAFASILPSADHIDGNTAVDTYGNVESLSDIEEAYGSESADFLIGNGDNNYFTGGNGSDYFDGRGGSDEVAYADEGGEDGIVVDLATGTGTDTFGNAETFVSIENIRGSGLADTIVGSGGRNVLMGLGGDDILDGDGDRDKLRYDRDDRDGGNFGIIANLSDADYPVLAGIAALYGASGAFTVTAGHVRDGFGDTDTVTNIEDIRATEHNDILLGNGEDNRFEALGGDDKLTGGGGDDEFHAGAGDDDQHGDDGDDYFQGAVGHDTIDGGADYDVIGFNGSFSFAGPTSIGVTVSLTAASEGEPVGAGTITGSIDEDSIDTTFTNIERVEGTAGADTFLAGPGVIPSDDGNRTWFEGLGDVQLFQVTGNAGNDVFTDTSGTPRGVLMINYDAEKWAHDGFDGGPYGGPGVTVNISATTQGGVAAHTAVDTFGHTDTISGIFAFQLTDAADTFYGSDAPSESTLGNSVRAGAGDDHIYGGSGNDDFQGDAGNDTLVGGDGRDSLDAGSGNDTVNAGADEDFIRGGAGANDTVDGGSGYDVLGFGNTLGEGGGGITVTLTAGTAGAGTVTGAIGDGSVHTTFVNIEQVEGTEGADSFSAGAGVINTGDANGSFWDTRGDGGAFAFVGNDGADTFHDMSGTAGGVVLLRYDDEQWSHEDEWDASAHGVTVNLSAATVYGVASNRAVDTYGATDVIDGVKAFRLTDGDDKLVAGSNGVYADGGAGNDILTGGSGNDQFRGGDGLDTQSGGGGTDIFEDVSNDDDAETISGGADSDYFHMEWRVSSPYDEGFVAPVADTVSDFQTGATGDVIGIERFHDLTGQSGDLFASGYLRLTQSGANSLLQFDADGTGGPGGWTTVLVLNNTTVAGFTARNFEGPATYSSLNDVPTATNLTQTKAYTEDAASVALDDIVVTDGDTGETIVAKLTLANPLAGSLTISGAATYNAANGVWKIAGTVSQVNAALAAVAFVPTANSSISTTIATQIRDLNSTGPVNGTITLTGTAVNDAPVNTVPGAKIVDEDTNLLITGLSIADIDAGSSSVTTTLSVAHGTLTVASAGGAAVGGSGTGTVTLTGSLAQINTTLAAANNVVYRGAANYNGADTLNVVTNDGGNTGTGGAKSDTDTVAITVNSVNDVPTATNLTQTKAYTEDAASVALDDIVVTDGDSGETIVVKLTLANPLAGGLTISGAATYNAANGVWKIAGTVNDVNAALAAVAFVPTANSSVSTTIATQIRDLSSTGPVNGTIALNGTAVNDAPVNTVPGAKAVNEDTNLSITGLSIADIDAGSSSVTTTLSVAHGALTVASAGGAAVSGSGTGTVTLTGSLAQINTTLAAANNVVYRGAANYNGADTLNFVTNDGGNTGTGGAKTDTDTVAITVNAVNDPASNVTLPAAKVFSNTNVAVAMTGLTVGDVDSPVTSTLSVAHGVLNVTAVGGVTIAGNGTGTVTVSGAVANVNSSLSGLTYLANNYVGADSLQISTTDGIGAADVDTVSITANPGVVLTNQAGTVIGGAGPDSITGNTGNNDITGGLGNDTLDGGAGTGVDRLWGEDGNDLLIGGGGDDTLIGGIGDDILWLDNLNNAAGASGNDIGYGGTGSDQIHGGLGNDKITGDDGNDFLFGDEGTDTLWGGANNDEIHGGADNDQILGEGGTDKLWGDAGADTFWFKPAAGLDTVMDFTVAGATHDLLAFQGFSAAHPITFLQTTIGGVSGLQVSVDGAAVVFLAGVAGTTLPATDYSFVA